MLNLPHLYTYIMYFSRWFASQLITLLFLLASQPILANTLYSYLDYLYIYLDSRQFFSMILIGSLLHLLWSIQGLPCQTPPFCNILYFDKCDGKY